MMPILDAQWLLQKTQCHLSECNTFSPDVNIYIVNLRIDNRPQNGLIYSKIKDIHATLTLCHDVNAGTIRYVNSTRKCSLDYASMQGIITSLGQLNMNEYVLGILDRILQIMCDHGLDGYKTNAIFLG